MEPELDQLHEELPLRHLRRDQGHWCKETTPWVCCWATACTTCPPAAATPSSRVRSGSPKLIPASANGVQPTGSKDAVASDTSMDRDGRPDHFHQHLRRRRLRRSARTGRLGQGRLCRNLVEAGHSGQRNCAFTDRPVRTACESDAGIPLDPNHPATIGSLRLRPGPELLWLARDNRARNRRLDGQVDHRRAVDRPGSGHASQLGQPGLVFLHFAGKRQRGLAPALFLHRLSLCPSRRRGPCCTGRQLPRQTQIASLTGKFIYASAETVGKFTSSDQDLNKIHALILAAIRSTCRTSSPTARTERSSAGSRPRTSSSRASCSISTWRPSTKSSFATPATPKPAPAWFPTSRPSSPVFSGDFRDSPEWGSAYVINPWHLYQAYGDRGPLDEHYANMKRYVNYVGGKASGNIVSYGLGDWYDVGPAAPGNSQLTTAGVTATAILPPGSAGHAEGRPNCWPTRPMRHSLLQASRRPRMPTTPSS